MSVSRRVMISTWLVCIGLVAFACGGDDDAASDPAQSPTAAESDGDTNAITPVPRPLPERERVAIAINGAQEGLASAWIADAMGEFEKENVEVGISIIPTQEALVALDRGDIHLMVGGVSAALLNLLDVGGNVRMVAGAFRYSPEARPGFYVRKELLDADNDLLDVGPFQKLSLGSTNLSSANSLPTYEWLQRQGLDFGDVERIQLGLPEILLALENGAIQGGWLVEPYYSQLEETGCCELVTPLPSVLAHGSGFVMNRDFYESQPEVAEAVLRALVRTNRTYLQDGFHEDQAVMEELSAAMGVPADALRASLAPVFLPDMAIDRSTIESLQATWLEIGEVLSYEEPIPIDDIVDTSVLSRVLEE